MSRYPYPTAITPDVRDHYYGTYTRCSVNLKSSARRAAHARAVSRATPSGPCSNQSSSSQKAE